MVDWPAEKLEFEDFYLLEAFQIAYLPGWVPEREFAAALWAYPAIEHFLRRKNPSVSGFINKIKRGNGPAKDANELILCIKKVIRTCSDILIYNKCPEVYDNLEFHDWDFREITSIVTLDDKVVLDGGSGTGRVALEAAKYTRHVFAMEPVTRLREFIREKANKANLSNLFVIDGFLHSIPLPDNFVDVVITSHAIDWQLDKELRELERVVKNGGYVIHCPGTADTPSDEIVHSDLVKNGYEFSRYKEADSWKRKYWKIC